MNSFYITLPSNACRNRFPNNTQANFTTMLDTPIELNGVFEVALAEIDYSTELSTEMGKLELTSFIRNIFGLSTLEELVIDIEMKNRITISDFTKQLDSLLSNKCHYYKNYKTSFERYCSQYNNTNKFRLNEKYKFS